MVRQERRISHCRHERRLDARPEQHYQSKTAMRNELGKQYRCRRDYDVCRQVPGVQRSERADCDAKNSKTQQTCIHQFATNVGCFPRQSRSGLCSIGG